MLHTDFYLTRFDNVNLYRTYSDTYYIKQLPTNIIYEEAIDVENNPYTYIETDIPLETVTISLEE